MFSAGGARDLHPGPLPRGEGENDLFFIVFVEP